MTLICFLFLFVCLGFPLEIFSLIWKCHHDRWKAANFYLCSAFMPIEQWGLFSVPYLLWHRASIYNGHLRGPDTHTYCREVGSVADTNCFYEVVLSRLGFEHPTYASSLHCEEYRHVKTWHIYNIGKTYIEGSKLLLLLENQQIMPKNMET